MVKLIKQQLIVLIALQAVIFAGVALADQGYEIKIVTGRTDAFYHLGETATFEITVLHDDKPVTQGIVRYILSNDGERTFMDDEVPFAKSPLIVSGTLKKAGFLRCQATYQTEDNENITAIAAAGFDPLKIKASLPAPDDFDEFWNKKKAALAKVPMNVVMTPVDYKDETVEVFDVKVDCYGGKPVSGYFARPKGAKAKSLPAILLTHGAGVGSSLLDRAVAGAKKGMLSLDLNAHGIINGQDRKYYDQLRRTSLKDYFLSGREDRDRFYFLGMYLRLIRAIDFLTSQQEYNGKAMIVRGSSQGGGQALAAAGLDERVTALVANVPALCSLTGEVNGRPDKKVFETVRYYDTVNFAKRIKAEAIVSVGFIDNVCRPTGVYTMYNNLKGKKEIICRPLMKHEIKPDVESIFDTMVKEHIAGAMENRP